MLRQAFDVSQVFAPRSLLPFLAHPAAIDTYRLQYWGPIAPLADVAAVDEGDMFTVLDVSIEAVATPGHTPGHIAYLARSGGQVYALTGDLPVSTRSYLGFYESCAEDLDRLTAARSRQSGALYLLPAHGRARPDGALNAVARRGLSGGGISDDSRGSQQAADDRSGRVEVALDLYGAPEPAELATGGDYSTAALVRSVLAPVRRHPVPRLHLRTAPRPSATGRSARADRTAASRRRRTCVPRSMSMACPPTPSIQPLHSATTAFGRSSLGPAEVRRDP